MLATFVIELGLVLYTLVRYKMTPITRLATAMLTLLAIFQLAEFNVCGGTGLLAAVWSRIGYIAITLLPPLGIHLILTITGRAWRTILWLGYATSLFFAATFGLSKIAFASHVCAGNYAIFQLTKPMGGFYFVYYYAWLFVGIGLGLFFCVNAKLNIRKALVLQVFGYLSFLLPTGFVNTVNPQTIAGIPSIMCGFAIIYALILAIGIVPLTLDKCVSADK